MGKKAFQLSNVCWVREKTKWDLFDQIFWPTEDNIIQEQTGCSKVCIRKQRDFFIFMSLNIFQCFFILEATVKLYTVSQAGISGGFFCQTFLPG